MLLANNYAIPLFSSHRANGCQTVVFLLIAAAHNASILNPKHIIFNLELVIRNFSFLFFFC